MDMLYRVHFKGPLLLAQALSLQLADGGAIINISTCLTRHVAACSLAYAAMKRAAETATRYLALELGRKGIVVNAIAPGGTETDFFGGAVRVEEDEILPWAQLPLYSPSKSRVGWGSYRACGVS